MDGWFGRSEDAGGLWVGSSAEMGGGTSSKEVMKGTDAMLNVRMISLDYLENYGSGLEMVEDRWEGLSLVNRLILRGHHSKIRGRVRLKSTIWFIRYGKDMYICTR